MITFALNKRIPKRIGRTSLSKLLMHTILTRCDYSLSQIMIHVLRNFNFDNLIFTQLQKVFN